MEEKIRKIYPEEYPPLLKEIKKIPEFLYIKGTLPPPDFIYLCVIGSRNHSSYGEEACTHLLKGLAGYPIVIVSGLAVGIDSLAHETALSLKLPTIAFPGSGLLPEVIYPQSKINLAEKILHNNGALISPFAPEQHGTKWTFIQRNRLMAAVSKAVLIIEGRDGSGTLTTAEYATQFNRDVMIVPGPIFSELSYGPHLLMRDGAYPINSSKEILEVLGFSNAKPASPQPILKDSDYSPIEKKIIENLIIPIERDRLIQKLHLSLLEANVLFSTLELKGVIIEEDGFLRLTHKRA